MNEAEAQVKQPVFANLKALHQQLEERVVKTKQPSQTKQSENQEVREPVLVIRGK